MSPEELKTLQEILESLKAIVAVGGWKLTAIPIVLMAAVNLYRLPTLQGVLEIFAPKAAWANLPGWAKLAVPFALAFAGALISALSGAMSWPVAIISAVVAGVSAVVTHHGAKTLAQAPVVTKAAAKLPVSVSRPLSIVLPWKAEELAAIRVRKKLAAVK